MGGCRCTFRSCKINTIRFPGMHFFHYPIRHAERLAEWIKHSNYTAINDMPFSKARNKVVCALHFRDECFMNYKKERLVPKAVPTLLRLRNGLVFDYSTSDNPCPTTIAPATAKHLIPPKGYLPLGLPEDYFSSEAVNVEVLEDVDDPEEEEEESEPRAKRGRTTPIILNKGVYSETSSTSGHLEDQSSSNSMSNELLEADEVEDDDEEEEEEFGILMVDNEKCELTTESMSGTVSREVNMTLNLEGIEYLHEEKDRGDAKNTVTRAVYEHTVDAFEAEVMELKQNCEAQKLESDMREKELKAELAAAREKAKLATERAEVALALAKRLQERLDECDKVRKEQPQATSAPKEAAPATIATRQIKKPQLFNGIKRYLSAAMTSLVCMEMFGGAERPWKAEEKRTALELLQLGEKVYDYFTEEWRFRLPPKKLVKEWQLEEEEEDDDL